MNSHLDTLLNFSAKKSYYQLSQSAKVSLIIVPQGCVPSKVYPKLPQIVTEAYLDYSVFSQFPSIITLLHTVVSHRSEAAFEAKRCAIRGHGLNRAEAASEAAARISAAALDSPLATRGHEWLVIPIEVMSCVPPRPPCQLDHPWERRKAVAPDAKLGD